MFLRGKMHYWKLIGSVLLSCFCSVFALSIENNAYRGITISFSESVREQHFDFEKFKTILEKSSEFLYHATRKRSFFGEFTVVVPSSWTAEMCEEFTNDSPDKVDVLLTDDATQGTDLKTRHSKGCGEEGDIIHMPLHWTKGITEDLSRQFVQQWSVYRYGVFEEDPVDEDSCYKLINGWSPVGCYNITIVTEAIFKNGLPVCSFPDDFYEYNDLKSSLMSKSNSSKILDFCDGSDSFPHNPSMPTIHNNLCEGRTVWSVVENSRDFRHGKNLPLEGEKPPTKPSIKCFKELPLRVTFVIQNSTDKEDLTMAMDELGSSLFQFLLNMVSSNSRINVVMFSDAEDLSKPIELDLSDEKKIYAAIRSYIKTYNVLKNNTCLTCGFQKALNATAENFHPSEILVMLAWESSFIGETSSELSKIVASFSTNTKFHLILVKDTEKEALPTDLATSIKSTGGSITTLPRELVSLPSKFQVILASLMKDPLQVEDQVIIVHEGIYNQVKSNFVDSFVTSGAWAKKLMYNMFCNTTRPITAKNPNCTKWSSSISTTFVCGRVTEFNDAVESSVSSLLSWEYSFDYEVGTVSPNCYSVALLLVTSPSRNSFTLRGWLSDYKIDVARNPLIIYAELSASVGRKYRVQAEISGPGMKTAFVLELRDNGNGDPDTRAGDGIFSRYFTSFSQKGTYVVSISAEPISNEENSNLVGGNEVEPRNIRQTKTIGSFIATDDKSEVDILPPNRIGDLRLDSVDHENGTAVLKWTAPGDDYDFGRAATYEVRYSKHYASLLELYFNGESSSRVPINIPNENGILEQIKLQLSVTHKQEYYVALRASDRVGNNGKISNIVQVYFNETEYNLKSTTPSPSVSTNTEVLSTDAANATTNPPDVSDSSTAVTTATDQPPEKEMFFDKKLIIVTSSAGGILLLIIIINIIVCCCCLKKRKLFSDQSEHSKDASLRTPYNMNIAYQDDTHSISSIQTDTVSMTTRNVYADPAAREPANQRYVYHTTKSLQRDKKDSAPALGWKLVQTLPASATSSLSRYAAKLDDSHEPSVVDSPVAEPQKPSSAKDAQLYSLGVV